MSIDTLQTTRLHVAEQRQLNNERFEINRRYEEKTDISERLGYHIDTTLHYEMRGGAAYCLSDTKHRAFHDQTEQAMTTGRWKFTGVNSFEYTRLQYEHEEALIVDAFGRGELNGNLLIKVSKVPDAVVNGIATVDGYRRDLLRSFVRLYYIDQDGLHCKLFTLDGNSAKGFSALDRVLGTATATLPSEAALRQTHVQMIDSGVPVNEAVEMLAEEAKLAYDRGVFAETGKKTYAGSVFTDMVNAMQTIEVNNDLFDEHYRAIHDVALRILSIAEREDFREDMRRKTAAAIKLRGNGVTVGSIGDATVSQEAVSGDYGRECATSGMNQAQQNESSKEITMTCPFCGLSTVGDPCASQLICDKCAAEVNDGRVTSRGIGRQAALRRLREAQAAVNEPEAISGFTKYSESAYARLFGAKVVIREVKSIGGARKEAVNPYSGEVYNANIKRSDLEVTA